MPMTPKGHMDYTETLLDSILKDYYRSYYNETQRLGQFYVNYYCTGVVWPELFYEQSLTKAVNVISQYLRDSMEDDEEE